MNNFINQALRRIWNSPTIMTWGSFFSNVMKLLIFTPLLLTKFTTNEIALWYLLLTINSFAVVVDFGIYPTYSRLVSYAFNGIKDINNVDSLENIKNNNDGPNWDLMERIYSTINFLYIALGVIVIFIITLLTLSPVEKLISTLNNPNLYWYAYFIFVFGEFFNFYSKKYEAIIIGTNHVVEINRWNIIINCTNAIFSIIIIILFKNFLLLSLNHLVFSVILCMRSKYLEKTICNGRFNQMKNNKLDKEIFLWSWKPTWQTAILIICSTGVNQASGLIYSRVSNPSELASYLLSLKLITTISQFSQAPFYSKLQIFAGLRIKNQLNSLSEISAKAMQKALIVLTIGLVGLIYLGDYGLKIIGSNAKLLDVRLLILISYIWFFERQHAMHAQIYVTTNKIPFYKSAIITGIVNICLMWILLPSIDVLAFPIAHGLSNLLINNWWNVTLSIKSMKVNLSKYLLKSVAFPFIVLLIATFLKLFSL